jgi:predicted nuclease of predicted toxin-antitoxin system
VGGLGFLCDENISRDLGHVARSEGFDVSFLIDFSRGEADETVLARALREDRILVTEDADFGRLIFSDRLSSKGVILVRIAPWKHELRKLRFQHLLRSEAHRLPRHFTALNERTIRFRPIGHDGSV